jgi:hypothetical protein
MPLQEVSVDVVFFDGGADLWVHVVGCTDPDQPMFTRIPASNNILFAVDLCRGDKIEILGQYTQDML